MYFENQDLTPMVSTNDDLVPDIEIKNHIYVLLEDGKMKYCYYEKNDAINAMNDAVKLYLISTSNCFYKKQQNPLEIDIMLVIDYMIFKSESVYKSFLIQEVNIK